MGRKRRRQPLPDTEFQAEIIDLAQDGRGIARLEGKVVFVAGALPGEQARFRLRRRNREFDEAVVTGIERASPDRVAPDCEYFGYCGGCALQHLAPAAQLAFKQKQLMDALERVGHVAPIEIAPPVTGPIWAYRRRARLAVHRRYHPDQYDVAALGEHQQAIVRVGFRERDRPAVARLKRCEVLDARVGALLQPLALLIDSLTIATQIPQIEVATSADAVALVFRVLSPPSEADQRTLVDFAAREGLEIYLQPSGLDSVTPLNDAATQLTYSPDGSDLCLQFAPTDFVQINAVLSQSMVRLALDWLDPRHDDSVLELFSGLGNFSLPLAAAGARVTAVEGEVRLVAKGRANAERNRLAIEFIQADLFKPDPQAAWLGKQYDLALLDPPRSGAKEVLPMLVAAGPQRIVYVSCHPATLARDADALVHAHGYTLVRAGVLDMFPHTAHVESMALFQKRAY